MTRYMVIGGGNLEAPTANIVIVLQDSGLKCSLRGLLSACHAPVDLVVIGVSGGGKEAQSIYHAARSAWTCHLDPSAPSIIICRSRG
jgi:hypothetical protein